MSAITYEELAAQHERVVSMRNEELLRLHGLRKTIRRNLEEIEAQLSRPWIGTELLDSFAELERDLGEMAAEIDQRTDEFLDVGITAPLGR